MKDKKSYLSAIRKKYGLKANSNRNPGLLLAAAKTLMGKKKRNPPAGAREIYGRLLRIEAMKGPGHVCDEACKRAGHKYYHDFTRHAHVYGLPDVRRGGKVIGRLLIQDET